MRRRLAILAMAVLLLEPVAAWAHAKLVKSDPARRAVLKKSPAQVRLWFYEKLEPSFSILKVLDAAGKPVTDRSANVSGGDQKLLELDLPDLPEGTYTVSYEVLSVDGHAVKSGYTFTVRGKSGDQ